MEQNSKSKGANLNDMDNDSTVVHPKQHSVLEETPRIDSNQRGFDPTQISAGTTANESYQSNTGSFKQTTLNPTYDSVAKTGRPGSVLKNRYDLLEKIGVGGMGTVYKALDRRDIEVGNSAFIAIKVLNDEFKSDPELLKALHSEARKTQSLAHPNILTVYDFDRDDQTVFMTMEYMQGATLDKIIKGNPQGLKRADVLLILKQICSALTYAHDRGIIHSDFKPANVFVDINNRVKVLDFGIARLQNFSRVGSFDAGVLGGVTPAYATLEMLEGSSPDPRDDIYALACVAYELFTGSHPFNREHINSCIKKHLQPKRTQILNNVEWSALKKALNFKRENRTESVESFLQDLEGKQSGSKTVYFVIAAALVVGLIAIGLNYYFPIVKDSPAPNQHQPENEKTIPGQRDPISTIPIEIDTKPLPTPVSESIKPAEPQEIVEQQPKLALPSYALELSLNKKSFKIGEQLIVKFSVKEALYVYMAVINSLGKVAIIYPNSYQKNNYITPGVSYQVPPKGSNATLDISGPIGTDKLVTIASVEPIVIAEAEYTNLDNLKQNNRVIIKTLTYRIN